MKKRQSRKEEREKSVELKPFDKVSLYSCASCSSQIAAIILELELSVYKINTDKCTPWGGLQSPHEILRGRNSCTGRTAVIGVLLCGLLPLSLEKTI